MMRARGERGFTLIEMIMVMMVLSIAAVSVLEAFAGNGRGLLLADNNHVAQSLAQQCADYVARAKQDGAISYVSIDTTVCNVLPPVSGFAVNVSPDPTESPTLAACPNTTLDSCKDTTITVTKGAATLATVRILFVNY